jgi:hypothetical protein
MGLGRYLVGVWQGFGISAVPAAAQSSLWTYGFHRRREKEAEKLLFCDFILHFLPNPDYRQKITP